MLPWFFLFACGLVFGTGAFLLVLTASRGIPATGWPARLSAGLPGLILVPVALLAIRPYLGSNLVGAGDSYHYALQVADFTTQSRQGVMPVLVGQSAYAFNGNVHTLRTAPYFTHLAGLLDAVSFHRLAFVQLQNLTVVFTSLFAACAAYFACLRISGGRRIAATLLAAFYVASPAISGPLLLQDMFATYMAVPWIVLCWLGLAGILHEQDDRHAQLLAAGSLGMSWLAHPPVAAWLTLVWGLVQILRGGLSGGRVTQWKSQLVAGLVLAGISLYVFASVAPLGARPLPPVLYDGYASTWGRLWSELRLEFGSILGAPEKATVRLGGGCFMLVGLAGGVFAWRRHWAGLLLITLIALLMHLLLPVPVVSKFLWWLIPERLLTLSTWPAQRLAPLLAAGTIVAAAWAVRSLTARTGPWVYGTACLLLAILTTWSVAENHAIQTRPGYAQLPPAIHEPLFSAQNLRLTRYSYDLFERTPGYFTHGWADPEHESRLFDASLNLQDNTIALLAAAAPEESLPLAPQVVRDLTGPGHYLLAFAFDNPAVAGEITLHGEGIARAYTLPVSGGPLSFGAGPHNAKTIPLRLTRPGVNPLTIGSSAPGVSVRILPVNRDKLPVRLHGLTPYAASVASPGAGFLETPKVYLSGYAATVNGRETPVRRSTNNLVMVPVPRGESEVVVTHPGPLYLRVAWFVTLGVLAGWPWLLLRTRNPAGTPNDSLHGIRHQHLGTGLALLWRKHPRVLLVGTGLVALTAAGILMARHLRREHQAYGSLRITLDIPKATVRHNEALLTTGRTGAADCLYIIYEDDRSIRLGLDHWGVGGPISDPISLDFGTPHQLEITIGSLYPKSRWFDRPGPPGLDDKGRALVRVTLDGRTVFDQQHPFHPARPDEVALGHNPVGISAAGESFSGSMIEIDRFIPAADTRPAGTGSR